MRCVQCVHVHGPVGSNVLWPECCLCVGDWLYPDHRTGTWWAGVMVTQSVVTRVSTNIVSIIMLHHNWQPDISEKWQFYQVSSEYEVVGVDMLLYLGSATFNDTFIQHRSSARSLCVFRTRWEKPKLFWRNSQFYWFQVMELVPVILKMCLSN